jgi:hypothetical protein
MNRTVFRRTVLGVGVRADITVYRHDLLVANLVYPDGGDIVKVIDESEPQVLHYLAELCRRNKLAVQRPSRLISAIYLCLAFDRDAHVTVYLGEQSYSEPGRSFLMFRPLTVSQKSRICGSGTTDRPNCKGIRIGRYERLQLLGLRLCSEARGAWRGLDVLCRLQRKHATEN